jgi:hypothetical protein
MALNMGMLASNDVAKEFIMSQGFEKGTPAVIFGASSIAGFFASACSLPFDYVKTQMQKVRLLLFAALNLSATVCRVHRRAWATPPFCDARTTPLTRFL